MELEKLKIRLNINDSKNDLLLTVILEDAEAAVLDFCNRNSLTTRMIPLVRELAIIFYNRQGTEGESSHTEGSMSVSYSTDIPDGIKARLIKYRLLKGAGIANEIKQ